MAVGLNKAAAWLKVFWERYGRAPRILHIGNIANNAYINAKMLNEIGYDCDVLCNDYYHIMGAPEWEDVDFFIGPADHNYPDWTQINLGSYSRPLWFAQGPLQLCADYLKARRTGRELEASQLWGELSTINRSAPAGSVHRLSLLRRVQLTIRKTHESLVYLGRLTLLGTLYRLIRKIVPISLPTVQRRWLSVLALPVCALPALLLYGVAQIMRVGMFTAHLMDRQARTFSNRFSHRFPDRADQLVFGDMDTPLLVAGVLKSLFRHYDLIHCYATAPILPMLAGKQPYVAYEHGTIREIPFEATPIGRLTALAYAEADVVMLTNADALYSLPKLRGPEQPRVHALHGFDERTIQRRLAIALARLGRTVRFGIEPSRPLFFSPARHDWAVKGNDVMLRAHAEICAKGLSPVLVLVRWGQEIARSEALIEELGVRDNIRWVEPLGKFELLAAYHDADAVLDQFVLECFGAVSIEVMSVGWAALVTSVDQDLMERFFGARIPLFSARSVEQVATALESVITDPEGARRMTGAALEWMERYHSHERVLDRLGEAYAATEVV